MDKVYSWWCPKCKEESPPTHVTFEERHEICGTRVEVVEDLPELQAENVRLERENIWFRKEIEVLRTELAKAEQAEAIADEEVEFQVKQRIILVERLNEADAKIAALEGQGGKESDG